MKKIVCMVAFVLLMVCSNRVEAADKYEVKLSWDSVTFDGRAHCPDVKSVKVNGHKVKEYTALYPYHCEICNTLEYHEEDKYGHYCKHYKKSYSFDKGAVVAGSYKIKVVVNDKTISKTFKIKRKNLKGMFRLSATKWIYTGKTIKPDFVWKSHHKELWRQLENIGVGNQGNTWDYDDVKSKDEIPDYFGNPGGKRSDGIKNYAKVIYPKKSKKCGKYKIVLKGTGNYTGTVTFKYSIVKVKDIKKACYKQTKGLMNKKTFEKRLKEFCSYSCYRDGAEWGDNTQVISYYWACQGFVADMGEFINPGKSIIDKKLKNARMGDMIDYDSHVAIVVGVDGKGIWTIGGNEMDHVSVSWTSYSNMKDGFHKLCHTVKK